MSYNNQLGDLGEAKAITKFIEHGFSIFTQFSGKNPFDFIAYRNGKLIKVEVKSTTCRTQYGSYEVYIRTSYGRSTGNVYKSFDPSKCDLLAIYLQPIDTLCFANPKKFTNRNCIAFRESFSEASHFTERHREKQHIISNYTDLEKVVKEL